MMIKGKYCGAFPLLRGETALLMVDTNPKIVLAQFDNLELVQSLTHGWKPYPVTDFQILYNPFADDLCPNDPHHPIIPIRENY